jgi:hypothetical protein
MTGWLPAASAAMQEKIQEIRERDVARFRSEAEATLSFSKQEGQ